MRDAAQIRLTPEQYADYKRDERRRNLRQLLGSLRRVRERREGWYVWVTEGQPILTAEQYVAIGGKQRKRGTSK